MESIIQVVNQLVARLGDMHQTYMLKIQVLESRVESVEHLLNQQSLLAGTLGDIMEELKRNEL